LGRKKEEGRRAPQTQVGLNKIPRSCVENKNKTTVIQNLNLISNSVTANFINIF